MRPNLSLILLSAALAASAQAAAAPSCREGMLEGELHAGQSWSHPLGNGLRLYFQPIAAGWITRVVPITGPLPAHDYAELATPPYRSVTPLSLSTDFSFRAQDAVGWNPRRFRFAASPAAFAHLSTLYAALERAGTGPSPATEAQLAAEIARAPEAQLTILDAQLTPGTADQWTVAAMVASHFLTTAHTLVPPADGKATTLGKLVSLRFQVLFHLPAGFNPAEGVKVMPHCSSY